MCLRDKDRETCQIHQMAIIYNQEIYTNVITIIGEIVE
jgi:hypothetical protein